MFVYSKRKLSACELQSIQMLAVSLEEASSADTVHSAITSTAEILSQQLLTSPVAMNLFSTSAGTQLGTLYINIVKFLGLYTGVHVQMHVLVDYVL